MGSMSASDAAPLPRLGEVFFDVRGSSRSMRLSWYSDTGVAVFSIWQGGTCTGTFRLPIDDLPRMVEALQRGPRGAALPAGESRDPGAERQRRGLTAASTDSMPAVASFPDYATGQIAPVTGEFRSMSPAEPSYREDPLGSGGYPAYRPADRSGGDRSGGRDRPAESLGGSFPGYADDGPPVYRDSSPPPAYRDGPLGAPAYRDDPLGSGGYPAYRPADRAGDRAPDSAGDQSLPGHRNPGPYGDDPLGSGGYPAYRPADRSGGDRSGGRDRPAESLGGSFPGYADDGPPVYRDSSPPPAYRDGPLGAPAYRDDPLGSGGYPAYRPADRAGDRAPDSARDQSLPGHRNPGPYGDDPLGLGYRGERPPSYRDDQYPPSYRDEPAPYPGEPPGPRYTDDPFQSVYPDGARGPGYPDDERAGSHPYGVPPGRPEPRAPRGRS